MSTSRYPDRSYFARIATEMGFRPEPLETVFRLADLLNRLTDRLGPELLLRGGTALNLIYLDLPRLSVDIDLDFVGTADAAEAQRRRPEVVRTIEDVASRSGYKVTSERASYAMSHQVLHYTDSAGRGRFLKVDVNFLDRVPVLESQTRTVLPPFGEDLPAIHVQTFAFAELAASKLIALVRRSFARDLFDVAMLSEVIALGRRPLPVDLAGAKELASVLMSRVFSLEDRHRQFLHRLAEGEIEPNRLPLPDPSRVRRNPGLLWRLKVGAEALEER